MRVGKIVLRSVIFTIIFTAIMLFLVAVIFFTSVAFLGRDAFSSCGKKYSGDFAEAFYVVDTYEENDFFITESTTLRVTYTEPQAETEGLISYCDKDDDRIYFIFAGMDARVEDVKFNNIAARQPVFNVKVNDYYSYFICLNSYDWSKGFNVNGTKINFAAKNN